MTGLLTESKQDLLFLMFWFATEIVSTDLTSWFEGVEADDSMFLAHHFSADTDAVQPYSNLKICSEGI